MQYIIGYLVSLCVCVNYFFACFVVHNNSIIFNERDFFFFFPFPASIFGSWYTDGHRAESAIVIYNSNITILKLSMKNVNGT